MRRLAILLAALLLPGSAAAFDPALPAGAARTVERASPADSLRLPTGAYADGAVPVQEFEGRITTRAWRYPVQALTTLQMLMPLRAQLRDAGFKVLFACQGAGCGGFDFRFATPILPAPDMQVDLFDFRYLLARKDGGDGVRHVALVISRTGQTGYVQVTVIGPVDAAPAAAVKTDAPPADPSQAARGVLARTLTARGHVVLEGLDFGSGSAALEAGPYPSLAALAAFLRTGPAHRVALVGHTDAVGGLDDNIALSRARAAAVLERLVTAHEVPRAQLEAQGIGYLAPRSVNRSAAGREANRRVEAVLLDTR